MYFVSFIIGLIIMISSIFMIRNELNKSYVKREQIIEHSQLYNQSDLFQMLENMQNSIDEMNRAFYEIADDLEGKYSIHEKEIALLNEQFLKFLEQNLEMNKRQESIKATNESAPELTIKKHQKIMDDVLIYNPTHSKDEDAFKNQESNTNSSSVTNSNSLRDKVLNMRSTGKSLTAIAKELDIGLGEIQLLIQLPNQKKDNN